MHHRTVSDGKPTVAKALGQTLATVQHLADLLVEWGSRKLKEVGSSPESSTSRKGFFPLLRRGARGTAGFLGDLGDAYYEWYEKLKARKTMRRG